MMIYVANPLYDAVFKYLMEDERIARTILSALLKKRVLSVQTRRNEYANVTRHESISMFRIDFAAKVEEEDGQTHLLLIELQKTWLPTETLRFRRYLALQYNNEENMLGEPAARYGMPMVAIYLLGHRVGNIQEPVIYVRHKAYDYNDHEVTVGMPDPFVESLQHDSIIVQIPLLHGRVNNRLEKVLSVFDQANVADDKKVIRLDDQKFEDDKDMEYVLRRLQSAAADPNMRYQMNAEDEFYKELEDRDTAIMERDKRLEEQGAQLKEQGAQLKEQGAQLKEQGAQLKEQDTQLKQQGAQLKEQNAQLKEQDTQLKEQGKQLEQKDAQIEQKQAQLNEQAMMLRTAILSLQGVGRSIEEIAGMLGRSAEQIRQIISDSQQ